MLVDAKKKQRKRAFDHEKLAAVLSEKAGKKYEPFKLPFQRIEFSDDRNSLIFSVDFVQSVRYDISVHIICNGLFKSIM